MMKMTMKTIYDNPYSKSVGQPLFDWSKIIDEKDDTKLQQSADWRTCIVGQLSKEIARLKSHAPLDLTLAGFGVDFATAYLVRDWVSAKAFLIKAQNRAKELLNIQ